MALREPSRWMTMSALLIIRRFWLDRMLPRRSGTGSESTSGWAAVAGALLLESPMETGRATGWWDCRADRDRILLLALRGEAGLADTSSLSKGSSS